MNMIDSRSLRDKIIYDKTNQMREFFSSGFVVQMPIEDYPERIAYFYDLMCDIYDSSPEELSTMKFRYGVSDLIYQSPEQFGPNFNHLLSCLKLFFGLHDCIPENSFLYSILNNPYSITYDLESRITSTTTSSVDLAIYLDGTIYVVDLKRGDGVNNSMIKRRLETHLKDRNRHLGPSVLSIVERHFTDTHSNSKFVPPVTELSSDKRDMIVADKLSELYIDSDTQSKTLIRDALRDSVDNTVVDYMSTYFREVNTDTDRIVTNFKLSEVYNRLHTKGIGELNEIKENVLRLMEDITLSDAASSIPIKEIFNKKMFKMNKSIKGYDPLFPTNSSKGVSIKSVISSSVPIMVVHGALTRGVVDGATVIGARVTSLGIIYENIEDPNAKRHFSKPQSSFIEDDATYPKYDALLMFKVDRISTKDNLMKSGLMSFDDWDRMCLKIVDGKAVPNLAKHKSTISIEKMAKEKNIEVVYFRNVISVLWSRRSFSSRDAGMQENDVKRLGRLFSDRYMLQNDCVNYKNNKMEDVSLLDLCSIKTNIIETPLMTKSVNDRDIRRLSGRIAESCLTNGITKNQIRHFLDITEDSFTLGMMSTIYNEANNIASGLKVSGTRSNDYFLSIDYNTKVVSLMMLNSNLEKYKSLFVKTIYPVRESIENKEFIMSRKGNYTYYSSVFSKEKDGMVDGIVELPFRSVDRNKLEYAQRGTHATYSSLMTFYQYRMKHYKNKTKEYCKEDFSRVIRDYCEFSLINNQNFSLISAQVRYLWISAMSESLDFTGIMSKMDGSRITNHRVVEYVLKLFLQCTIMTVVKSGLKSSDTSTYMRSSHFHENKILKFNFPDYPFIVKDPTLAIDLFSLTMRFNKNKVFQDGYLAMDFVTILDQDDKYLNSCESISDQIGVSDEMFDELIVLIDGYELASFIIKHSGFIKADLIRRLDRSLKRNGKFLNPREKINKSKQFSSSIFYQMSAFIDTSHKFSLPSVFELSKHDMSEYFTAKGAVEHKVTIDFNVRSIRKFNAIMEFISSYLSSNDDLVEPAIRNCSINEFSKVDISKFSALNHIIRRKSLMVAINKISDKSQSGGNREITSMNAVAFIMTNVVEWMFSEISKKNDTDMIMTRNKIKDLLEFMSDDDTDMNTVRYYLNIDRSKWATNTMQSSLCLLTGILAPDSMTYKMVRPLYDMQMRKHVMIPDRLRRLVLKSKDKTSWHSKRTTLEFEHVRITDSSIGNFIKRVTEKCSDPVNPTMLRPYAIISGGFPQGTQGGTSSTMTASLSDFDSMIVEKALEKIGVKSVVKSRVTSDDMLKENTMTFPDGVKKISGTVLMAGETALQSLSNQIVNVHKSNPSKRIGELNSAFVESGTLKVATSKLMFANVNTGNLVSYESDIVGASLSGTSIVSEGGSLLLGDFLSIVNVKLVMDQYNMWSCYTKNLSMSNVNNEKFLGLKLPVELGGLPGVNTILSLVSPLYPIIESWVPLLRSDVAVNSQDIARLHVRRSFVPVEKADDDLTKWTSRKTDVEINYLMSESVGGIKSLIRPSYGTVKALKRADTSTLKISMVPNLLSRDITVQNTIAVALSKLKTVSSVTDMNYDFLIRHSDLMCNSGRAIFSVSRNHPMFDKVGIKLSNNGDKLFSRDEFSTFINSIEDYMEIGGFIDKMLQNMPNPTIDTLSLENDIASDINSILILRESHDNARHLQFEEHHPRSNSTLIRKGRSINTTEMKLELFHNLVGTAAIFHYADVVINTAVEPAIDLSQESIASAMATVDSITTKLSKLVGKPRKIFNRAEGSHGGSNSIIYDIIRNNTISDIKVVLRSKPKVTIDSIVGGVAMGSSTFIALMDDATNELVAKEIDLVSNDTPNKVNVYSDRRRFSSFAKFSSFKSDLTPHEPVIEYGTKYGNQLVSYSLFLSLYSVKVDLYVSLYGDSMTSRYMGSTNSNFKRMNTFSIAPYNSSCTPVHIVLLRTFEGTMAVFTKFIYHTGLSQRENILNFKDESNGEELTAVRKSFMILNCKKGRDRYVFIKVSYNKALDTVRLGNGLFAVDYIARGNVDVPKEIRHGNSFIKLMIPLCELTFFKFKRDYLSRILRSRVTVIDNFSGSAQVMAICRLAILGDIHPSTITNDDIITMQQTIKMSRSNDDAMLSLFNTAVWHVDYMGLVNYRGFIQNDSVSTSVDSDAISTIRFSASEHKIDDFIDPNLEGVDRRLIISVSAIFSYFSANHDSEDETGENLTLLSPIFKVDFLMEDVGAPAVANESVKPSIFENKSKFELDKMFDDFYDDDDSDDSNGVEEDEINDSDDDSDGDSDGSDGIIDS